MQNQGTIRRCKKCNKQLLDNEKKYCRHCKDKRKRVLENMLAGVGAAAGAVALAAAAAPVTAAKMFLVVKKGIKK